MEVDAQHLFRANGIGYDAQVYLPGIGRVDFLIEGFLIVEVDGFAFHSSREALRRDLGRNNASTLGGFAVLRYMPEHIWFEPERVLAEIRAVLGRRSQPVHEARTDAPAPDAPAQLLRRPPPGARGFPGFATSGEAPRERVTGQERSGTATRAQRKPSGSRRGPAPRGPRRRHPSG